MRDLRPIGAELRECAKCKVHVATMKVEVDGWGGYAPVCGLCALELIMHVTDPESQPEQPRLDFGT